MLFIIFKEKFIHIGSEVILTMVFTAWDVVDLRIIHQVQ
jgi:hypothetical protein